MYFSPQNLLVSSKFSHGVLLFKFYSLYCTRIVKIKAIFQAYKYLEDILSKAESKLNERTNHSEEMFA